MEMIKPRTIPFRELRVLILKRGYYAKDIARMLNMSEANFSAKLNGKSPWRLEEAYRICEVLDIPYSDIPQYFPKPDVMA